MLLDEGAQSCGGEARHIAVTDEYIAGERGGNFSHRTTSRVAGAALFGLQSYTDRVSFDCDSRGGCDHFGLMTDDDHERVWREARDRAQHSRDHRFAGDLVQHLGAIGTHPGAEAGSKDYGGEWLIHLILD